MRDRGHQAGQRAVAQGEALPYQDAWLDRHQRIVVGAGPEAQLGGALVVPAELAQPALGVLDLVRREAPQRGAAQFRGISRPFAEAGR